MARGSARERKGPDSCGLRADAILVPAPEQACRVACMASVCTTIALISALSAPAVMMVANVSSLLRDFKNLKPRDDVPPL